MLVNVRVVLTLAIRKYGDRTLWRHEIVSLTAKNYSMGCVNSEH